MRNDSVYTSQWPHYCIACAPTFRNTLQCQHAALQLMMEIMRSPECDDKPSKTRAVTATQLLQQGHLWAQTENLPCKQSTRLHGHESTYTMKIFAHTPALIPVAHNALMISVYDLACVALPSISLCGTPTGFGNFLSKYKAACFKRSLP